MFHHFLFDLLQLLAVRSHDTLSRIPPRPTQPKFKLGCRLRPVPANLTLFLVLPNFALDGTSSNLIQHTTKSLAESLITTEEILLVEFLKEDFGIFFNNLQRPIFSYSRFVGMQHAPSLTEFGGTARGRQILVAILDIAKFRGQNRTLCYVHR